MFIIYRNGGPFFSSKSLSVPKREYMTIKKKLKNGQYEFIKFLNEGSHGKLYKYEDTLSNTALALKKISLKDKDLYLREVKALTKLNHPNICPIKGHFEEDGDGWIVMELLKGNNLKDRIESGTRFTCIETINIIRSIAHVLNYIHSMSDTKQTILHRDIKPENIFITNDNVVKLIDFGISKTLDGKDYSTNESEYSPQYSSPDLFINGSFNAGKYKERHDIFSLGAVAYELIFREKLLDEKLHQLSSNAEENISKMLKNEARILKKMIDIDEESPYQEANDLLEDLDLLVKQKKSISNNPAPKTVSTKTIREGKKIIKKSKWKRSIFITIGLVFFGIIIFKFSFLEKFFQKSIAGDESFFNIMTSIYTTKETTISNPILILPANTNISSLKFSKTNTLIKPDQQSLAGVEPPKTVLLNENFPKDSNDNQIHLSSIDCKNVSKTLFEFYKANNTMNLKKMGSYFANFLEQALSKPNRTREQLLQDYTDDYKGYLSLHSEIDWKYLNVKMDNIGCNIKLEQVITKITTAGIKTVTRTMSELKVNKQGKIYYFRDKIIKDR